MSNAAADMTPSQARSATTIYARAKDVTVGYPGEAIVEDINFELPQGQAMALKLARQQPSPCRYSSSSD